MTAIDFATWVWPVTSLNGRRPVISHEFVAGERFNPDGTLNYAVHLGVDLMFPRWSSDPTGPANYVAIPRGGTNQGWITWPGVHVIAAGPGKIWEVGETALGRHILIDHGQVAGVGILTFYQHIASLSRVWGHGDTVQPGNLLGIMGGDPTNPPHLVHLHFEVWLPDGKPRGSWPVNPEPFLALWVHT